MAIALAESLLERGSIDGRVLGRAFADAYDPGRGDGAGTTRCWAGAVGAPSIRGGGLAVRGEGSQGNVAAMRIGPVALRYAYDGGALAKAARESARVTLAHPLAVDAAVVQAAAIVAAPRGEPPLDAALAAATTPGLKGRLTKAARLLFQAA